MHESEPARTNLTQNPKINWTRDRHELFHTRVNQYEINQNLNQHYSKPPDSKPLNPKPETPEI